MEFYWRLACFCTLLTFLAEFSSKKYIKSFLCFFIFGSMFLLSSIRIDIGTDYYGHEQLFWNIKAGHYFVTEPMFLLVCIFIISLGLGFKSVIVIMSLITLIPIYLIAKKENKTYILLIYLLLMYLPSYCLIRQYAAISLATYAIYIYQKESKTWISFFLFLMAGLFHYSLFVFMFCFYISRIIKFNLFFISIFSILFFILTFKTNIIMTLFFKFCSFFPYGKYLAVGNKNGNTTQFGSGLGVILRLIISYAGFYIINRNCKDKSFSSLYNTLFFILIIFDSLSCRIVILMRLRLAFSSCYFIPLFYLPSEKSKRNLYSISFILLLFIIFGYALTYPSTATMWKNIPYKSIFGELK